MPIAVKDFTAGNEKSLLEMALIENIQREDLNPIEEALAYQRLADEFQLKQEDIASAVGKDRATVANHIRLLRLPEEIRAELSTGRLTMGHARALLSLADEADQRRMARDVIARSLSVRETESLVRKIVEQGHAAANHARGRNRSRPMSIRALPRNGSDFSLAPRSASCATANAVGLRSISFPKMS